MVPFPGSGCAVGVGTGVRMMIWIGFSSGTGETTDFREMNNPMMKIIKRGTPRMIATATRVLTRSGILL